MTKSIETDYLVVGAGAAGMAFTDSLLAHSDATVTIVDRRLAPGGHWQDVYPHVRLHQPSSLYGVSSVPLGEDRLDEAGTNAGFYELAGADEIRAYYERVMHRHFLPTGRVRFFPSCDYVGAHRFVSRLTGASTEVRVRRKLVDTTYLEGAIPATSPPPFEVAEGVRCVPAGAIAATDEAPEGFVIVGAGKTAMDTCIWLLERGVPASDIRWIKPRESWWINRKFQQARTLFPDYHLGVALQLEAMAEAASINDVFARLEEPGFFQRVDPTVAPTMFRGAIASEAELDLLRRIEGVVRLGKVQRIERDEILLDHGRVPTHQRATHVHCAAAGLAHVPPRPIFEAGRITTQPFAWGFACYQFATLGVVEAILQSDEEKNRLCPALRYWDNQEDYARAFLAGMVGDRARAEIPALRAWMRATRLNPAADMATYREDPRVVATRDRVRRAGLPAATNLQRLLDAAAS